MSFPITQEVHGVPRFVAGISAQCCTPPFWKSFLSLPVDFCKLFLARRSIMIHLAQLGLAIKLLLVPRRGHPSPCNIAPSKQGFAQIRFRLGTAIRPVNITFPMVCSCVSLHRFACLRERGCQSLGNVASLVFHEFPESGCNVRLCDVDVIPSCHGW